MKVKVFVSLTVIAALLTLVTTMPASTYVPSPDELALVVGGWMENKSCEDDLRCTGTNNNCPDDSNCDGKQENDACGSSNLFSSRDGCASDNGHKCKYDNCSTEIQCTRSYDCSCRKISGSEKLGCSEISPGRVTKVYPCTDQEM